MNASSGPQRQRTWRILRTALLDVLLLPLAFAVVLLDDVLWDATLALLRRLERVGWLRSARGWVAGLPAMAVLPLFLLPEGISHLSGFLGAVLLARGQPGTAILLLVLVKGMATLAVVWIYQAASATLLAVGWFAWLHDAVQFVRGWSLSQIAPLRDALRARLQRFGLRRSGPHSLGRIAGAVRRRFAGWRTRLAAWLGGPRMML